MHDLVPRQELFWKCMSFQGGYESFAIHAARELGLLALLAGRGACPEDAARSLGCPEVGTRLLMNCLVTAGVLESDAGTYSVAPRFRDLLTERDPEAVAMLDECREIERLWSRAADLLRAPRARAEILERFAKGPAWTAMYQRRVHAANVRYADVIARRIAAEAPRARSALDIGGGHGEHARRLAAAIPGLGVTVVDLEDAVAHGRGLLAGDPVAERVRFVVGDARTLDHDAAFDVVLMNDLLHYFVSEEKATALRRAIRALRPGGLLATSKFRLDASGASPRFSAYYAMQKHLENPNGGHLETDDETAALLRDAGARDVRVVALDGVRSLLTARSPAR